MCTLNRRLKCKARAITRVDDPSVVNITCAQHNHDLKDYKRIPKEIETLNIDKVYKIELE